jgi:DNA adenine methylase
MSDEQHRELAGTLNNLRGAVIVSGYACDLYDRELYPDWQRLERRAMADGALARTEVLWLRNVRTDLFS